MIKMTLVTDSKGKLVGAVNGDTLTSKHGEVEARVSFPQGHKLLTVEVEDDLNMSKVKDAAAFQDRLLQYLPKS
jgi:hypothetical protein